MTFDCIVIGAGHNGLACAAYLAKAGAAVLVVERSTRVGGGCHAEEATLPGFKHNLCSGVHTAATIRRRHPRRKFRVAG